MINELDSGVASFEEIIDGVVEAFNLDRDLAAFLTAIGMVGQPMLYLCLYDSDIPNYD